MTMTDPIADMLTRIRNANSVGHKSVQIPASNMKKAIAQILLDEGYITDYKINDDTVQGSINILQGTALWFFHGQIGRAHV